MKMNQDERRFDFHGLVLAIKQVREERGWTQAYLAELVEKTDRTIPLLADGQKPVRYEIGAQTVRSFPGLEICLREQAVICGGKPVHLSHYEFFTLWFLTKHPGWVFTKEQIYEAVWNEPGDDPDAIMVQIRDLFGETLNWSRTMEEFNTDALSTVGAFLQPMHSMTYFILLLAAVGVANNLLINYMQKRRTIAMYKSVGLFNRQNRKMTLVEGFSSGLIGAVIAIFVSYLEIQTIFLVAGPEISMVPELDAAAFLTAGGMGILATLLGSVVPILKSRRMRLVEEIKAEHQFRICSEL